MSKHRREPERAGRTRRVLALVAVLPTVAMLGAVATTSAAQASSTVTKSRTITRTNLDNGKNVVVDHRTFSVTVRPTTELRDRQEIDVSWKGAHPTGGIYPDPNSEVARQEEYPVVLLQCRGVDSTKVPKADQLSPETCWTQAAAERYFMSPSLAFPPWRVDRYAAASDRRKVVGAPKHFPATCSPSGYTERWLPFRAASGKVYAGGNSGCAGQPPEASGISSTLDLPSNTTYATTAPDGHGSTKFDVWTSDDNASLGCSDTVPCSLVVVPIEGISCDVAAAGLPPSQRPQGDDATAAQQSCEGTGHFDPGSIAPQSGGEDLTVTGALWWSASNWRNRVTVPLSFAPLPTVCGIGSSKQGIDIYGSELMTDATTQWSSKFCQDSNLFPFQHIQTGEPQARNLLSTGSTDAAFTTFAPDGGYATPVASAPVAFTGFSVAYTIDDANGQEVTNLKLTPRLLAKLLTESYPAIPDIKRGDAALSNNPIDISDDPEFQALNPDVPKDVSSSASASTLLTLSSDSDVIHALTSYINADPEARAWLNGKPDPWGMKVNPNYKHIKLPVDSWPLLDTYEPTDLYDNGTNDCLHANPVPYLPLVASPTSRLAQISLDIQFSLAPSQLVCQLVPGGGVEGAKLVALGREVVGHRFLIGVTSLADAARYKLDSAALQTRVASDAPVQFSDASGRTFVRPDDAGLAAAAKLLVPQPKVGIWTLPYDKLTGSSGDESAYPGAMLVEAAIPTGGLASAEAKDFATFLRFAATSGQVPGGGDGQLPPGYLPMTAANNLGAQATYTRVAAQAVGQQHGFVPNLAHPSIPAQPTPAPSTGPGNSGSGHQSTGGSGSGPGSSSGGGVPPSSTEPTGSSGGTSATGQPGSGPAPPPSLAATLATKSIDAGLLGTALPFLIIIALVAGLFAPMITRFGRRKVPA